MVVLDRATAALALPEVARAAIAGGADLLQVREKHLDRERLRPVLEAVIESAGGPAFVSINSDHVLASEFGTGLHLPDNVGGDRSTFTLADQALLGRSIHSGDRTWTPEDADYLILGSLFETTRKPGKSGLGVDRFAAIARTFDLPVLAIGGIHPDTVKAAFAGGASGVAVSSYVNSSDDPERAAREIRSRVDAWKV